MKHPTPMYFVKSMLLLLFLTAGLTLSATDLTMTLNPLKKQGVTKISGGGTTSYASNTTNVSYYLGPLEEKVQLVRYRFNHPTFLNSKIKTVKLSITLWDTDNYNGSGGSVLRAKMFPTDQGITFDNTEVSTLTSVYSYYFTAGNICNENIGTNSMVTASYFLYDFNNPSFNTSYWEPTSRDLYLALTPRTGTLDISNVQLIITYEQDPPIFDNTICCNNTVFSNNPYTISGSQPTGGINSYTYRWFKSTDNATWSLISGATSQNYAANFAGAGYYKREVSSGNATPTFSDPVYIDNYPAIADNSLPGGNQQISCNSDSYFSPPTIIGTYPSGGNGSFSYRWYKSTNASTWSLIAGATGVDYTPVKETSDLIYYKREVISGTYSSMSAYISYTYTYPNPLTNNVISYNGNSTYYSCFASEDLGVVAGSTMTSAFGTVLYQWQYSTDNGVTITNYAGATSSTFDPAVINQNIILYRLAYQNNCNKPLRSNPLYIYLAPSNTIAGDEQFITCSATPATITNTTNFANTINPLYQWQKSDDGVLWVDVAGATSQTFNPGTLYSLVNKTFYFRRQMSVNNCPYTSSNVVTKQINPASTVVTLTPGPDFKRCNYSTVPFAASTAQPGSSFSWYKDGALVSGPSSASNYITATGGAYYVTATNTCGTFASPVTNVVDVPVPFCNPTLVNDQFCGNTGWSNTLEFPRMMVDITNDGLDDIVGFAAAGVFVSIKKATGGFKAMTPVLADFGQAYWPNTLEYPRYLKDVNDDDYPDIVGFGPDNVRVALNNKNGGFSAATIWCANQYGVNNGWSDVNKYPRFLANVNDDVYPDIVAFSQFGVFVSLNLKPITGENKFGAPQPWTLDFCPNTGWADMSSYPRSMVDMNGDDKADIVGCSVAGVLVSLSTGSSFAPSTLWSGPGQYGPANGFESLNKHPRFLVDMNNDGAPDIIGFKYGVLVSLNLKPITGELKFGPMKVWSNDYAYESALGPWTDMNSHPRSIGDINGDGFKDVIGFSEGFMFASMNNGGTSLDCASLKPNFFTNTQGWTSNSSFPRMLTQLDSDNRKELIGFSYYGVVVMDDCNGNSFFRMDESAELLPATTEESSVAVVSCFPNPAKDKINFRINKDIGTAEIDIFDGRGQKVRTVNLSSDETTISLGDDMGKGVYYYVVKNESGKVFSERFVVE